jgi:acyl carrier protein
MNKEELLNSLLSIVRTVLDDEDVSFTEVTNIGDVPEWDSLSNMHIVVRIEKKYGIDFQQSDLEKVTTIGDLLDRIEMHLVAKSS